MEQEKAIGEILQRFPKEPRFALAILQEIQKEFHYISKDNLQEAAGYLSIPIAQLFSMATFYKALSLNKKGKIILKVCDGTACHIRGSSAILSEIQRVLGIQEGETTEDGLFSLEVVNCVGSCAMAPVVISGNEYHGSVKLGQAKELIEDCKRREAI